MPSFLRAVKRTTLLRFLWCSHLHFIFALLRRCSVLFRMKGTLLAPFEINWASTKDGPRVRNHKMSTLKSFLEVISIRTAGNAEGFRES